MIAVPWDKAKLLFRRGWFPVFVNLSLDVNLCGFYQLGGLVAQIAGNQTAGITAFADGGDFAALFDEEITGHGLGVKNLPAIFFRIQCILHV